MATYYIECTGKSCVLSELEVFGSVGSIITFLNASVYNIKTKKDCSHPLLF